MNKMKLVLSLFAAMALTAGLSAQTVNDVNEKFNAAGAAMQAKDFVKAAALFEEVAKEGAVAGADAAETVTNAQRYLPQALMMAGQSLAAQQKYNEGIEYLAKARDLSELYGNAQVMRQAAQRIGQVYFVSGADAYNNERYTEAIDIFSKGFEADPNNTDMALNLARSYDKLDSLQKAVEVYNSIIALESRHSRYVEPAQAAKEELALTVLSRASEAAQADDYDTVISLTDMLLAGDPANAIGNMMRLQAANNKKDYRGVIEYGEAAAEAQTDAAMKSDAYFLLGAAYQNTENKAKAIEAFRKVTAGNNATQARNLITELQK